MSSPVLKTLQVLPISLAAWQVRSYDLVDELYTCAKMLAFSVLAASYPI
jgi:hypothetical protein